MVILPMVRQVAVEEPEMAAKMPQPSTLQWTSRPGSASIHGAMPRNMSSEMRLLNRISPIQMKSGSAVSAQLVLEPQTVVAMSSPAGELVKNTMPMKPRPSSAMAIHTPPASSTTSAASRISEMLSWSTR